MSLLLPFTQDLHLCVGNNSDHAAVLLNLGKIFLNLLLTQGIRPLGAVLGVGLLLTSRPVLVKSSLSFLSNMLSPHSLECSQTTGGINIADNSDNPSGGVSRMVTASTTSFLLVLEPGRSISRTM